jgi:hypothetical protein
MVESSSTEEEDGEFKHKKANEEVIPFHSGDSFSLPTPETLWKTLCAVPGAVTPPHSLHRQGQGGTGSTCSTARAKPLATQEYFEESP